MEEKQEVFNPPQVLKLPRPSRSWPRFNSQQIRAAGNCNTISLSQVVTSSLLRGITTNQVPRRQRGKELSRQGHLVVRSASAADKQAVLQCEESR